VRSAVLLALLVSMGAAARPTEDELEIVASTGGFRPAIVNVRKGETVHLRLKTADREHCFALDAFRIEKRVTPGKTTSLDLTPDKVGTFPYYCCLETGTAAEVERGRLVVGE